MAAFWPVKHVLFSNTQDKRISFKKSLRFSVKHSYFCAPNWPRSSMDRIEVS